MSETMKDTNIILNVGGVLTHANGVQGGGGELVEYDSTPIGGPPAMDVDVDVRSRLTWNVTTRVVGDDDAARAAFVARFNRGEVFDCKATAALSGEMAVSGEPDAIGKRFVVTSRNINHQFQQNSELSFTLSEQGPTPT
jgi:hypothetical protein